MKRAVWAAMGLAGLAGCVTGEPEEVSGRAIYQDYCLACHGDAGKGDGPGAAGMSKTPADLTRIAARSGGEFPLVRVMSVIDGYTRRDDVGSKMPEMGPFFQEGRTVIVATGEGVETPTPERLLALAEYLRTIQE